MLRQKLDHIHQNPVKRGFVDEPEHWRWSSARCYAGRDGVWRCLPAGEVLRGAERLGDA